MITEGLVAAVAGGIGAILTGLGALIVNVIKAKKTKTGDRELEYNHMEKMVQLMSGVSKDFQSFKDEVRLSFDGLSTQLTNFRTEQKEYNITMIRHDIVQTYETYKSVKKMPEKVWVSTLNLYEIYRNLGGNSWITELVDEMRKWGKN